MRGREEGGRGNMPLMLKNAEEGLRNKKSPERCLEEKNAKSEEQARRKVEGEG